MKRYGSIFLNRIRIQFRIAGYYALIPLVLFLMAGSTIGRGESLLAQTGYVTQALLFLGMLLGYRGGLRDHAQAGEYLDILPLSYVGQLFSLLAEWCFILLVHGVLWDYIALYGILHGAGAWYYRDSFCYLLLYELLPALLGSVVGRLFGLLGRKALYDLMMIVIGFLLGPMGRGVCEQVSSRLFGEAAGKKLTDFINIGQIDIHYGMDLFYGLQIERKRFAHVLLFLFAMLALWSICVARRTKRTPAGKLVLSLWLILMAAAFAVYREPCYLPSSEGSDNAFSISYYDRGYYQTDHAKEEDGRFLIRRLTGTVDTRRQLAFSGEIEGEVLEETDVFSFRLYHDLRVSALSGEGIVSYEQQGDTVRFYCENAQKRGSPLRLSLRYEGTSSPYFYANERAVFLPAYFNWLPCPGAGNAMRITDGNDLSPVPVFMDYEVRYDLLFCGRYEPYSNLERDADGHLRGISDEGVYLLGNSHMRTYRYDGGEIVSCVEMPPEYAYTAGNALAQILADLRLQNGQQVSRPQRILLIPHHVLGNTVSFEYAGADTVYFDAHDWTVIRDYSEACRQESFQRHLLRALRQFETRGIMTEEADDGSNFRFE